MKQIKWLQGIFKGLTDAFGRYPLTAFFLIAAASLNAYDISAGKSHEKYLMVFAVGAFLSLAGQAAYERYLHRPTGRWGLMATALLLTAGYYFVVMPSPGLGIELGIRTAVALFALLVAFIWIPSIKNRISFNESFIIAFKAFFNALLFSGVLMAGISIILAATDQLLFSIDGDSYSHVANIVFVIFGPMYFLSLIPVFPGEADRGREQEYLERRDDRLDKAAYCPRFLEILISYIIIPLVSVFTVILVVYILRNIGGSFWTDNLLEPMLVSYAITVILIYILASRLENKFASYFRHIFPKVLVPIVVFQITASVLSLGDTGITHTRYFAILFGIFAAASGIVLSIVPVGKNGIVAAMLVVFSVISIVPPVDAFTISRADQTGRLEAALARNNMLVEGSVKPAEGISEEDKKVIIKSFGYLRMMDYTDRLKWLPENFDKYGDFNKVFGFNEYDNSDNLYENIYLVLDQQLPVDISGYDSLVNVNLNINVNNGKTTEKLCDLEKGGIKYTLNKQTVGEKTDIALYEGENKKIINFDTSEILKRLSQQSNGKSSITPAEATFLAENQAAKVKLIVKNANIEKRRNGASMFAELYVLVAIK